jgi:hypothetical protein
VRRESDCFYRSIIHPTAREIRWAVPSPGAAISRIMPFHATFGVFFCRPKGGLQDGTVRANQPLLVTEKTLPMQSEALGCGTEFWRIMPARV